MRQDQSERELVERAQNGNRQAFDQIVRRLEPTVATVVIGMLGNTPEADDVGQEAFLSLYRHLSSFRFESSLKTYVTKIAMNYSLNELKRRKRLLARLKPIQDLEIEPVGELGGEELDRFELQKRVHAAILTLDSKYRSVVLLRMVEGYSTLETAEMLGIPKGTVLSRLSRGLKMLKPLLASLAVETERIVE